MTRELASRRRRARRSIENPGLGQSVARLAARSLILVVVLLAAVELLARIANWGDLPVLPYKIVAGVPHLPGDAVLDVRFSGSDRVRYVTDSAGFRVHDSGAPDLAARRVFVAGDSQVLGYGYDFETTFAAQVSRNLFGAASEAVILGTPAMDPELLARAIDDSRSALPEELPVAVLALNFGNDLDELFSAGGWYRGVDQPTLQSWLLRHSVAYMTFVQRRYATLTDQTLIPGINRIFYSTTPEERVLLLRETVDLMIAMVERIGATRSFVVLIPQDIQVFPKDFAKYRKFFTSPEDHAKWSETVPQLTREFGLLQDYAESRLRKAGIEVVLLSDLMPPEAAPEAYFSRTSHHLLPAAHRLIAAEITDRAKSGIARP